MISILVFKHRLESIFLNCVLKTLLNLCSSFLSNTGFPCCQFTQTDPKNETQTKSRGQTEERRRN